MSPPASTARDWRAEVEATVRGECLRDAPLAPRTAIRVGGPADLLVRPADAADLAALLGACRRLGVPVTVLGGGANLLVSDRGIRGAVVRLPPDFGEEEGEGGRLVLPAGAPTRSQHPDSYGRGDFTFPLDRSAGVRY